MARREATSPDGGAKKSLLAHKKSLSMRLLVSKGVERKRETAVSARASSGWGTSMTSAKKS